MAFVIMPFSREFERIFVELVQPALPAYDVIRADSHLNQHNILRSIAEGISQASLVIADVTGTNANVMYELGAAHALGKPTVMIAQSIDALPFDLRSYPVQAYATQGAHAEAFTERLREIGEKHIAGLLRFGNPIVDFLPLSEQHANDDIGMTAPETSHGTLSPDDEYGFLDYSADMEEYGGQIMAQFDRLNALNVELTTAMTTRGPALQKARDSRSAAQERRLLNEVANAMQSYASAVTRDILPLFHVGWDRVGYAMHWMALQKPANADDSQIEKFCKTNEGLRQTLTGLLSGVIAVRDRVVTGKGLTSALTAAIREIEQAFNATVSEIMLADALMSEVHARMAVPPSQPANPYRARNTALAARQIWGAID